MHGWIAAFWLLAMAAIAPATAQQPDVAYTVTGTVVDEEGAPLAGVAVGLLQNAAPVDVQQVLREPAATSGNDGRFTFRIEDGVPWSRIVLLARRGRQAAARSLRYQTTGDIDLGPFVLPPAATLVGRVRDVEGKPIAGARIRVSEAIQQGYNNRTYALSGGTSNARGIFQVPCVPRTGLLLTVHKDGFQSQEQLASHDSPLSLTLVAAPVVRGIARTDDGEVLANARVTVQHEGPRARYTQPLKTDENGALSLTAPVPPTRYRILVSESEFPHRRFESDLLRGAPDSLTFHEMLDQTASAEELIVRAVDKATGSPIANLSVAATGIGTENLQTAMFHADNSWRDYDKEARISKRIGGARSVLVRAEGYAFACVDMPEEAAEPLVLELEPEAVIEGRVLDDAGEPIPGVAVRALPCGNTTGSGGRIGAHWPRTDAQGRYRIGSLQPGRYALQAYPDAHAESEPFEVDVEVGKPAKLDLTMPKLQDLRVEIVGALPGGPEPILHPARYSRSNRKNKGFRHTIAKPAPRALRDDVRSFSFGALDGDRASFELFVPSRTRVGAGTTLHFEGTEVKDGIARIELPDLERHLVRGRIRTESALPSARIAVLATREEEGGRLRFYRNDKATVGVFGDGTFAIDLPPGRYCLQLADILTGIVFHTEAEDLTVHARTGEQVLQPELHWLQIELRDEAGAEARTHSFVVTLDRPREGKHGAFVQSHRRRNQRDTQTVNVFGTVTAQRWLVPAGQLDLDVNQREAFLQRNQRFHRTTKVTGEVLDIQDAEHRLVIEIPSAPTDEQLEKKADGGHPLEDVRKGR